MKRPELSNIERQAFWQLPIAPLDELARVLGTSPQQLGKIAEIRRYRLGGQVYCCPPELAKTILQLKVSE